MKDYGDIRSMLASAAVRIMLPLVRILLRHGISYKTVAEWLRWCFVKVATEEFQIPGKRQTKSRVAVVTGLTRVDVDRLQKMPPPDTRSSGGEEYQRAARVLSAWARDSVYLDANGSPLDLPIDGDQPSIDSLVARHAGGAPTRAVLDDLVHVGAVRMIGNKAVLVKPHYSPLTGDEHEAQVDILGQAGGGLLRTIDHNTQPNCEETWLQGQAFCARIPASIAPEVRRYVKECGRQFLYQMDGYLFQMAVSEDQELPESTVEIGVGTYLFTGQD